MEKTKTLISDLRVPFFVYGTLRPGFGNDRLWADVAHPVSDGTAWIEGHVMALDYGVPFAVHTGNPDHRVLGCLVKQDGDDLDVRHDLLRSLDRLEGYPHVYDRHKVVVHDLGGVIAQEAWVYHASNPEHFFRFASNPADFARYARVR